MEGGARERDEEGGKTDSEMKSAQERCRGLLFGRRHTGPQFAVVTLLAHRPSEYLQGSVTLGLPQMQSATDKEIKNLSLAFK